MRKIVLLTLLFFAAGVSSKTLIHAGKLITSENNKVLEARTIVVNGDEIESIQKGYLQGADGDTVIDLKAATVMPGLMDMHVHLSMQHGGPQTYLQRFQYNEADYALAAANFAEKTLMSGFTTVRNLGDGYNETVALRKAVNAGIVKGPRIYTSAKSIATTGGHADPSNGTNKNITPPQPQIG